VPVGLFCVEKVLFERFHKRLGLREFLKDKIREEREWRQFDCSTGTATGLGPVRVIFFSSGRRLW
jgi:hypothetical protein